MDVAYSYHCAGRRVPVCPYCHRVFNSASSQLRRHIWIHEGIKPFECHICQYACRTCSNLAAHMLRHSADKPFLCNSCGKAYKSRTALRWHERSHISGRIFKCDKYAAFHYSCFMPSPEALYFWTCMHPSMILSVALSQMQWSILLSHDHCRVSGNTTPHKLFHWAQV